MGERRTSYAKYAATATATSPEIGTIQSRGCASKVPSATPKSEFTRSKRPPRRRGPQRFGGSLGRDGGGAQTGYRSRCATAESLEERTQGRRVREAEEQGPRLADYVRARPADRLARARASRRATRQVAAGRPPYVVRLPRRGVGSR